MQMLNNDRGSLLMISYALIFILLAFGAAAVILVVNDSKSVEWQKRTAQAFYVAEAGIERAMYDLKQDFINDPSQPSFSDGAINSYAIGPNTTGFYPIPYSNNSLNGGSYTVTLKNITGVSDAVWVRSTGGIGNTTQTIEVYPKLVRLSVWDNAIFAGRGASGRMINGNVNIAGSVHILGSNLSSWDYAVDLGGTADIVKNNYGGLDPALAARVPALPTTNFNGETVSTLNAKLRVKHGKVGLSGAAGAGEADAAGNAVKETVDEVHVTDGFGGNKGSSQVYSDNGWSNTYDLGNSVPFPSLSDPHAGYPTYQQYLRANALVINDAAELAELANLTPNSNFNYSGANGAVSMDGNGNLAISGIVYIEGGDLNFNKAGSKKTITYAGTGALLTTGSAQINVNLVTSGNNSFPTNILGLMTPNNITMNEANIDVMGLFYAENTVTVQKQTDIMGTIVGNYFDMGTNVPAIFQVPETVNHLPPGMIGADAEWMLEIVSWQKL